MDDSEREVWEVRALTDTGRRALALFVSAGKECLCTSL